MLLIAAITLEIFYDENEYSSHIETDGLSYSFLPSQSSTVSPRLSSPTPFAYITGTSSIERHEIVNYVCKGICMFRVIATDFYSCFSNPVIAFSISAPTLTRLALGSSLLLLMYRSTSPVSYP